MSIDINGRIYDYLELLPEDIQGWSSDDNLYEDLVSEYKPQVIVEIGTWKGYSAIKWAEGVKNNNLNCKVYCIDTWLGASEFHTNFRDTKDRNLLMKNGYPQIYYQFLSNVVHKKMQNLIVPIPNTSNIGFKILKYHKIVAQIVYIDGSHDYQDVKNDLNNYYSILDNNGVLICDDYKNYYFPGVKQAADEFCKQNNIIDKKILNGRMIIKKKVDI